MKTNKNEYFFKRTPYLNQVVWAVRLNFSSTDEQNALDSKRTGDFGLFFCSNIKKHHKILKMNKNGPFQTYREGW